MRPAGLRPGAPQRTASGLAGTLPRPDQARGESGGRRYGVVGTVTEPLMICCLKPSALAVNGLTAGFDVE